MNTDDWTQALFASIDAKDTTRFLGFLTDDAEFRYANAPAAVGKPAVGDAVDGFFRAVCALRHDLDRTWTVPGHVICHGHVTYTRLDGKQVTLPFANILGLRDGLIHDYRIYIDAAPLFS